MIDKKGNAPTLPEARNSPRPGDFQIGSVESRAAARARLQAFEPDEPRPGDVVVDLTVSLVPRAKEIFKVAAETSPGEGAPSPQPEGKIWFKFPEGTVPPKSAQPMSEMALLDSLSDEFLCAVISAKPKGDQAGYRNVPIFRDAPEVEA